MFMIWQDGDARIVRRVLSGRHNDFGVLVERYLPAAQAVARGNLHNPEDAEDVTQESFVSAFQKLDTLRTPQKFGPWFMSIVRNTARTWSRRQHNETSLDEVTEEQQAIDPPQVEREEVRRLLRQTLQGMDQERREILMLHYFADKSLREIAALQGISREAAAKRLQRAREALSEELLKVVHDEQPPRDAVKRRAKVILAVVVASPVMWQAAPAYAGVAAAAGVLAKWAAGAMIVGAAAAATYVAVPAILANAQGSEGTEAAAVETVSVTAAVVAAAPAAEAAPAAAAALPAVAGDGSLPTGPRTLTSQLVDLQDRPVPDVDVTVELVNWGMTDLPPEKPARWTGRADAGGNFTFENLPEGFYCITAMTGTLGGANDANLQGEHGYAPRNVKMYPVMPCSGTVCDEAGAPIAGAVLYPVKHVLFPDEEFDHWTVASVRAQSDAEGHFAFKGLIPGGWILFVVAPGRQPFYTEPVQVPGSDAKVVAGQPGSLSGRVTDARDGQAMPFVKLLFTQGDPLYMGVDVSGKSARTERIRHEVKADADGLFRVEALMPGDYRIRVDDPMLCLAENAQTAKVASAQETKDLEVRVSTGGLISGRVTDKNSGAGIAGVQVSIGSSEPRISKNTLTGADGAYAIGGLAPGSYEVNMYSDVEGYVRPEYSVDRTVQIDADTPLEGIDFSLEPGAPVAGIVVDKDGNPVEGAEVNANTYGNNYRDKYAYDSCKSGTDGAFVMTRMRGDFDTSIQATKDDWRAEEVKMHLGPEGVDDLTLRLDVLAASTIKGRVTDESGKPVNQAMVMARLDGDEDAVFSEVVKSDGSFTLESLQAGRYILTAQPYERGGYSSNMPMDQVNAKPLETVVDLGERMAEDGIVVQCPGAGDLKISGRVLSPDGKPMPFAALTVAESPKIATVLLTGAFEFTGLHPGTYTVYATAPGYSPVVEKGVEAGRTDVVMRLAKPATLRGRVIDVARNAPVTAFTVAYAARVQLQAIVSPGINGEQRFEDANGEFRIEGMSTLPMTLNVRAAGYAPWQLNLDGLNGLNGGQENEVLVELEAGGAIAGFVHDAAGNPVGQASITVSNDALAPSGVQIYDPSDGNAVTTGEGRFELRDVPAETPITVTASREGFAAASAEVTPEAGAVTPVEIVMSGGGSLRARVFRNGVQEKSPDFHIQVVSGNASSSSSGRFEENGDYIVEHLTAGEASVHASLKVGETYLSRLEEVMITEGSETLVELDFGIGTGAIEGTILVDGVPAADAIVIVKGADDGESTAREADESGYFRVEGLPAGEYRVYQSAQISESLGRTNEVSVALAENGTSRVDWYIEGGGTVRVNATGFPWGSMSIISVIEGAVDVQASREAEESQEQIPPSVLRQVVTGDGVYALKHIPPGTYTLILTTYGELQASGVPEQRQVSLGVVNIAGSETVEVTAAP